MRRGFLVVAMVGALTGEALAQPRFGTLLDRPDLPASASVETRLAQKMTLLTGDVGLKLEAATFGLLDLRADFLAQRAQLRLGGGGGRLGLHLDSNIVLHGDVARVDAHLAVAVLGKTLKLDLPDVEVLRDSVAGESVVQLRLPVFEGRF